VILLKRRLSSNQTVLLALAGVILVGIGDWVTGPDLAFSVFYLPPIMLVAWRLGWGSGAVFAVLSAMIWLWCDLVLHRYTEPGIHYWNGGVRLLIFLIVAYTLAALKNARDEQEELIQFVIHDLRSPLTNMLAALQLLDENDSRGDRASMVSLACSSGDRMLGLIDSLNDLGRLEGGRMPLDLREEQVSELVDGALRQVSAWADKEGITLECRLEGPAAVLADARLTVRVIVNLLGNAIKFSPSGSAILIRTQAHQRDSVAISITDEGPGIPPEWAKKAFEKFGQVQARHEGVAVGSGLGLAFCKFAVEAQAGLIWLESDGKNGSTVAFTLPRA